MVIAALAVAAASSRTVAAETDVPPQVDKAIADGIAFLAKQQRRDGSSESGGPRIAMTGLTLMSFLAAGHVPDEGRYGMAARAAMEYLIASAPADGYFGRVDGSRMYGHGIATLALAEAYGADHNPQRRRNARAALERAVQVIFKAQDVIKAEPFGGGWRYEPTNPDSDLSLSGWNALALRAAANVGIEVPRERINRALEFVMRCYRPQQNGFAYQPDNDASIAMTGVGMLNLYLLEGPGRPELAGCANSWRPIRSRMTRACPITRCITPRKPPSRPAMRRGRQSGNSRNFDCFPASSKTTAAGRKAPAARSRDESTPPAWPALTLSVPYRLLPIYQR